MGIRTDDHIPGYGKTFLRKQGMFDTHLSHFEIIRDLIASCKLTDTFAVLRRFNILIGNKMIRYQCDLILIEHSLYLHFIHFLDCHRTGNIVAQHQIQLCLDQLSCLYLRKARCLCKYLLCHCHSHCLLLLFLFIQLAHSAQLFHSSDTKYVSLKFPLL